MNIIEAIRAIVRDNSYKYVMGLEESSTEVMVGVEDGKITVHTQYGLSDQEPFKSEASILFSEYNNLLRYVFDNELEFYRKELK